MAETTNSTSRRAVIMALAGTPFLAGTIAGATSTRASAATMEPTAWDRALANYRAEDEANGHVYDKWDRADDAYRAAVKAVKKPECMSFSCTNADEPAEKMRKELEERMFFPSGVEKAARIEDHVSEFKAYQAKLATLNRRFNLARLDGEVEAANARYQAALATLIATPPVTVADFADKLETLGQCCLADHATLIEDARRLAARGA